MNDINNIKCNCNCSICKKNNQKKINYQISNKLSEGYISFYDNKNGFIKLLSGNVSFLFKKEDLLYQEIKENDKIKFNKAWYFNSSTNLHVLFAKNIQKIE